MLGSSLFDKCEMLCFMFRVSCFMLAHFSLFEEEATVRMRERDWPKTNNANH